MRIQEILEVTNLSKKAVYFYIQEGLINPIKNIDNGYYDFSHEDLSKLQIINTMRSIGMSIQDIRELFQYPTLTNFFLHRQINNLKKDIYDQINKLQTAYYLIEKIPTNAKPDSLEVPLEIVSKLQAQNSGVIEKYFPNIDCRMIAIMIWAAFTDIEAGEYHNFLWEKISNELSFQLEHELIYLKKIIYQLSSEQIYNASAHMFNLSKEITFANPLELKKYEDKLLNDCKSFIEDERLQEYWALVYEPVIKPTAYFLGGEADKLFKEYNPQYTQYSENMVAVISNVLKTLEGDRELMKGLVKALRKDSHIKKVSFSDLSFIYSFNGSIFTQIQLNKLKKLINEG